MDWLVVALGNPVPEYAGQRHNAGELLADALVPGRTKDRKLKALHSEGQLCGRKVSVIFPQTYMNLSGEVVAPALRILHIPPEKMIVWHDEIDLPVQEIRHKFDGGHAGHNGLRNIMGHLGHGRFHRLRLGVGRPQLPSVQSVSDYVLSRWPASERITPDQVRTFLEASSFW